MFTSRYKLCQSKQVSIASGSGKTCRIDFSKKEISAEKIIHSDCLQTGRKWPPSDQGTSSEPQPVRYNPGRLEMIEFRRREMPRTIELTPYSPNWPTKFELEAQQLVKVFGDLLISIHHIGSTAIPGIKAKPIIDIMVVVQELEKVEDFNPEMIRLGYSPRGEAGIPGRRFFRKDSDGTRSHHVHIYARGHEAIQTQLNFRDYLRAHPEEALAYSRMKEALAVEYRYDSETYTESKTGFITEINQRAAQWRKGLEKDD
jgi:GrpB-like predicted nucleotidyltransferase (UPF0157 family)